MRALPGTGSTISLRTQDPDKARAIVQDRISHHSLKTLNGRRTVDFTLRQAQLDRVAFFEVSYGSDVETVATGSSDFYFLQLTLAGRCEIITGAADVKVNPGSYFVVNPRTTYRKRWSSDARQLIIRFPRRTVEQLSSADSAEQPVVFDQSAHQLPSALNDLINFFWRDITTEGRVRVGAIDRSASRHLVKAVLHLLPNSASAVVAPSDLPDCLLRADRYIRQSLAHDIGLTDIADAAGVSIRSLEGAFRRHWRTTPLTHVRNLRLDAAHHILTHPADTTSVTAAALASGFTHFGRFSQVYSRRFGELPSESLRRGLTATN
jgi:AraC-like DNA-binding protein